jgi:hypothetical protein
MEKHPAEVLREALALPVEARAALLDSLIESLDENIDADAEAAWQREIEFRVQQIDSGQAELIAWRAARKGLRDRLER